MKSKIEHLADGRKFASREEVEFYYWCCEARTAGIVGAWSYQPRTFELAPHVTVPGRLRLKTHVKSIDRHLLNDCRYTPDFLLMPGPRWHIVAAAFAPVAGPVWVDVKGTFARFNDDVKFSLLQKWTFDKFGVYVHKIIPEKLFPATFVPRRAAAGRDGAERKKYLHCRSLGELLNENVSLF